MKFQDELRRLDEGAAGAPWDVGSREGDDWDSVVFIPNSPYEICQCFNDPDNTDECSANTRLIAYLRNNCAAIADLVDAAQQMLGHFTKTPSTLADTEIRGRMHKALSRLAKEPAWRIL